MKLAAISGLLTIFTTAVGMTATAQAVISPTTAANNLQNGVHKNLIAANSLEQAVHNQINQYRQSQNLPPLVFDQTVADQARLHSVAMSNAGSLSHNGFDGRAAAIEKTITYSSVAENVASNSGYSHPESVAVKGWIKSPGHQKNMVGNYGLTGIGVVEKGGTYYFTQIFVRQR
jgi:uncharacterized protein YkwD